MKRTPQVPFPVTDCVSTLRVQDPDGRSSRVVGQFTLNETRLERARELLIEGKNDVTGVIRQVG